MEFFDGWIEDDKDGSKRKKLNAWISLFHPLMKAITHGDAFIVKTLIDAGAIVAEEPDIVKMLIDAGADVNCSNERWGRTALMLAVTADAPNIEVIKTLIELGANVNARDYIEEKTILAHTENGNVKAILRATGAR